MEAGKWRLEAGKGETVKSDVLLREIDVLRGGGGAGWRYFSYFLVFGGVWKLVGTWKLLFWRLEGLEAGKWEAGGWTMWGQNKRIGGFRDSRGWFLGLGGRTYRRGESRKQPSWRLEAGK